MKGRRTYTADFKFDRVIELLAGQRSLGQLSREYSIKASVIARSAVGRIFSVSPREHTLEEISFEIQDEGGRNGSSASPRMT